VDTNCGSFTIALDSKQAPKTTGSFVYLVKHHVYDDTLIHRIQPGFVIQGGDPLGNGTGGPGYHVDERPPSDLAYTLGVAAMARTQAEPPGRSGSQFFVVTVPDAGLDPTYALLGKVTTGLDVVERIGRLGTQAGVPTETVVIKKITLAGS
jgi:peptidyl-prolyl cis-trans isomerase B (cyclophilin B)